MLHVPGLKEKRVDIRHFIGVETRRDKFERIAGHFKKSIQDPNRGGKICRRADAVGEGCDGTADIDKPGMDEGFPAGDLDKPWFRGPTEESQHGLDRFFGGVCPDGFLI